MSNIQLTGFTDNVDEFRSEQVNNRAEKNAVIAKVQEEFCNLNPARVKGFFFVVMTDETVIDSDGDEANPTRIRMGGTAHDRMRMLEGLLQTFISAGELTRRPDGAFAPLME